MFVALLVFATHAMRPRASLTDWPGLDGCEIHPSPTCSGSAGDMDPKWADHQWNTPNRSDSLWRSGYQDYYALQGYAQQKYSAGRQSCKVTVLTRTSTSLDLQYEFDGDIQSTPSKTYTSDFTQPAKIRVIAKTGETLVLDDVDFIWNLPSIPNRPGDFRKGQKGAIVEFFGWPDGDIEDECEFLAENGYLGAKLFPHMEQIMSTQPNDGSQNPWWFMYQPASYRLEGRMGTRSKLRSMIQTCRAKGVRVYADAVVNHMSGGGNDASSHRNPDSSCAKWPPKLTSAPDDDQSPYYTPEWTYQFNPATGRSNNVLEYPAVPYGQMDFHCEKSLNAWTDPNILNTGWLVGLADLDTSKDYVRQRIADHFIDLLSIGFSGFRIDAAKHIHPDDIAVIIAKMKSGLGGDIPADWFTWLEVLIGGEADLLVRDSSYSFTTHFTDQLKSNGLSDSEIDQVKIWWSAYPVEVDIDEGRLSRIRKVIQNDDHDQQSPGSSSRDMHDQGCVLVKGCEPDKHRGFEVKLFEDPYYVNDNDNEFPIRMVLSSFYFPGDSVGIPDGKSDCSVCKVDCTGCKSRKYAPAYIADAKSYEGTDYTHVHRDPQIIAAMKKWMHIP